MRCFSESVSLRSTLDDITRERYLSRYKELHKQKTGEELDNQAVLEHFNKLITLVRKTFRPIPKWDEKFFEQLLNKRG